MGLLTARLASTGLWPWNALSFALACIRDIIGLRGGAKVAWRVKTIFIIKFLLPRTYEIALPEVRANPPATSAPWLSLGSAIGIALRIALAEPAGL